MEKARIPSNASNSIEDFSEFADAEESISAPTELLAEFLYSVMVKDYENALGYCTQILSYEPDNATVKEFHPLIEEKLEMIRNGDLENDSSDSSLSCSSSTSDSSDSLHSTRNETCSEEASLNSSSLESDEENNDISETCKSDVSQSDITNGNTETTYSSLSVEDSTANNNGKEINTSATRTIIHAKLLTHKTHTRVLSRDSAEVGQSNEINHLKNENPPALHSTNTMVFTKENFLPSVKNNNSRTLAWFNSLQENIFGNIKRENPRSKSIVQNARNSNNNAKEKKKQ